jgi:hypothetical protein
MDLGNNVNLISLIVASFNILYGHRSKILWILEKKYAKPPMSRRKAATPHWLIQHAWRTTRTTAMETPALQLLHATNAFQPPLYHPSVQFPQLFLRFHTATISDGLHICTPLVPGHIATYNADYQ